MKVKIIFPKEGVFWLSDILINYIEKFIKFSHSKTDHINK